MIFEKIRPIDEGYGIQNSRSRSENDDVTNVSLTNYVTKHARNGLLWQIMINFFICGILV